MKLKAKEVKVGMTIKWGVVKMTVEKVELAHQKNGKELRLFSGNVVRSMGRGVKPIKYYDTIEIKADTLV